MQNETVIAVLATVAILVTLAGGGAWVRSFLRDRRIERQMYVARLTEQSEINKSIHKNLNATQEAMKEMATSVAKSLTETSGEIAGVLSALDDSFSARTEALSKSLDPEVSKKFATSVDRLAEVITKHAADIERFGDAGLLMASSCRKMNDNITALRTIVYGGKRAEDFSFTSEDPEGARRAEMESEVMTLMQDHNMPRAEAEKRVRQLYSTRSM